MRTREGIPIVGDDTLVAYLDRVADNQIDYQGKWDELVEEQPALGRFIGRRITQSPPPPNSSAVKILMSQFYGLLKAPTENKTYEGIPVVSKQTLETHICDVADNQIDYQGKWDELVEEQPALGLFVGWLAQSPPPNSVAVKMLVSQFYGLLRTQAEIEGLRESYER